MSDTKSFRHQNLDLLSYKLLPLVPKHLLHLGIDQDDLALLIQDDHGIWSRFQKPTKYLITQQHATVAGLGLLGTHTDMVSTSLDRRSRTGLGMICGVTFY